MTTALSSVLPGIQRRDLLSGVGGLTATMAVAPAFGASEPQGWARAASIVARVQPPRFPKRDFNITDFGAKGDGTTLATEAIAGAIRGGRIDTYGSCAPDGIVGPRGEKEASFDTIRAVRSPIQINAPTIDARFDGTLRLSNHYDFTSLADVAFGWEWVRFATPDSPNGKDRIVAAGELAGPKIAPMPAARSPSRRPPPAVPPMRCG